MAKDEKITEPIFDFKIIIVDKDTAEFEKLLYENWRIDSGWQNPNGSLFVLMRLNPNTEVNPS